HVQFQENISLVIASSSHDFNKQDENHLIHGDSTYSLSSIGLARILNVTLSEKEVKYSIQTKVAPVLFQAVSTIPNLAQISFVGIDGVYFSLSSADNRITALYTNGSSRNGSFSFHKWYTQSVSEAGEFIGEARATAPPPAATNSTILLKAFNNTYYASVGAQLSTIGSRYLFLNTVIIDRSIGVISLGFPVKMFSDYVAARDLQGGGLYVATKDGVVVASEGVILNSSLTTADHGGTSTFGGLPCNSVDKITPDTDSPFLTEVSGNKYEIYCSTINLAGVPLVYVLALPYYGLLTMIHKHNRRILILLIVTVIAMVAFVVSFISLAVKSTRENMRLNAQLIKQMETTQQAEKKSNNKSMAIATASHDVRANLCAIIGLIDLCYHEITPGSELKDNNSELKQSLKQMKSCANDLLALLNSILDTSKIESGKMELQDTEFNLAQLVEELADLYHPVGMKNCVEVVLDPCDGSRRLWQAQADTLQLVEQCSLFQAQVKRVEANLLDLTKRMKMDTNCIEFVFEVDDTGVGIPKDKHKTVFENFEQVNDAAVEVGGTGLGLGIVRSLVQLMGGDIEIMDKSSYRGTCFRFNVFLVACDLQMRTSPSCSLPNHFHNILLNNIGSSERAKAPPSSLNNSNGSLVVLLIQNKGRRKMIQNFLEAHGLRVMVAKEAKFLPSILKKVKYKLIGSSFYSASDLSPRSCFSSSSSTHREDSKNVPLTALDGSNETVSALQGRPILLGISCVLLIVDANAGEFSDLSRLVFDFKKDVNRIKCCKVVWLEKPETRNLHFHRNDVAQADYIFIKPLQGSRLFQVIGHLPEFGGKLTEPSPKRKRSNTMEVGSTLDPDSSEQKLKPKASSSVTGRTTQMEIEEIGSSSSERSSIRQRSSIASLSKDKRVKGNETELAVRRNPLSASSSTSQKPLLGKKILIAEDHEVQKHIAIKIVKMMDAAVVETCKNGKEALYLVCKGLKDQALSGSLEPPYHYILMDCQMPEMDGFESTRRIRIEEAKYGLRRIPIFALTAHESVEICESMLEAGMDAHLDRPLTKEKLVKAIRSLQWLNDG
ncbi:hypothetical protein V2J09_022465, partial [Rumex salicifolius]